MIRTLAALTAFSMAALSAADRYHFSEATAAGPGKPRLVVLHDEEAGIRAAVAPSEGGELSGLELRHAGSWIETIYRARDYTPIEEFAGRAMFLWPATGRNILNPPRRGTSAEFGYELDGKRYPITIHGFARSMPWNEVSREASAGGLTLALELTDTPETLRQYPFGFRITATYRLSDGDLVIAYAVRASGDNSKPMPFSIGNHIAFLAPLTPGSDGGGVTLESPSKIQYLKDPPGIPNGKSSPLSYAEPTPLSELPPMAAISLAGYEGEPYVVLRDPQGLSIRISHTASSIPEEPVILFNLWGDPDQGFYSPEPWVGLQNSLNQGQGLVHLSPGQQWEWKIRIQPRSEATP